MHSSSFQPNQKIYYTPDYGMTGAMGIVVSVDKENGTIMLSINEEDNEYDFPTDAPFTVPADHVYSQKFLDDW